MMAALALSVVSGWVLVLVIATTSWWPWRRARTGMSVHFTLAYVALPLCVLHGWAATGDGWLRRNEPHLTTAMAAMGLLILQIGLGMVLCTAAHRPALRRAHLLAMLVIAALAAAHIAQNGSLVRWQRT
jgi:hypothetical protein